MPGTGSGVTHARRVPVHGQTHTTLNRHLSCLTGPQHHCAKRTVVAAATSLYHAIAPAPHPRSAYKDTPHNPHHIEGTVLCLAAARTQHTAPQPLTAHPALPSLPFLPFPIKQTNNSSNDSRKHQHQHQRLLCKSLRSASNEVQRSNQASCACSRADQPAVLHPRTPTCPQSPETQQEAARCPHTKNAMPHVSVCPSFAG